MMDLYMILLLAGFFGLMTGLLNWCVQAVDQQEGDTP